MLRVPEETVRQPSFVLCLTAAASLFTAAAARGQVVPSKVAGVVRDAGGNPVSSAEVRVDGAPERAVTDGQGLFVVRVASADVRLIVRRLGFKPTAIDVSVAKGEDTRVDVQLESTPQQLTPVTVSARPEPYEQRLAGYYDRAAKKAGHFVGPERLDHLTSHRFTDILREVPGVRIVTVAGRGASQRTIRLRGAQCPPFVFVDGFPAGAGEFELDMVDPSTIEGVEIYSGIATVPAQFVAPRGEERCGVIALWSRPARPGKPTRREGKPPQDIAALLASNVVFTPEGVDIKAELKPGTATAVYPDSLWSKALPGHVLTEFVVDTAGFVESETIGIVSSTHPAFARAAMAALSSAEFRPALKNGRRVRQIVQLPFVFLVPTAR